MNILRLSSSYSAFVIKARANKRNRNAPIVIDDYDELIDDSGSTGSNSTIDETLHAMKREALENQPTAKQQSHFESFKSSYSDVCTISTSTAVKIKSEIIENSTNNEATQSNTAPISSISSDAEANVIGEFKCETIEEPKAKDNDEPINVSTVDRNKANISEPRNKRVVPNESTSKSSTVRPNALIFYCLHCQDESITSESFRSVHQLHNHWLSVHAKSFQPFQFYAGLQCACYLCKKTGSFKEIFNHFIVRHPGRRIGITKCSNVNKCAICDFVGHNMADHFQLKHPITTYADVFNPIRFSEDFLNKLNAIDVHKKFKCRCCDHQSDTESRIIDHYTKSMNHNLQKYPYEDLIEKLPPSYECGLCKSIMEKKDVENHFKNHVINCPNCSTFMGTNFQLQRHQRLEHSNDSIDKIKTNFLRGFLTTKIIQSNGLVLNQSNLLRPTDDESKILRTLFETLKSSGPDSNEPGAGKTRSEHNAKASDYTTIHCYKRNVVSEREAALSSISFHHSQTDLPERKKQEHLAKQKILLNNLHITGLPENDGTRDALMNIFTRLCKHINVPIEDNDVTSIQKAWFNRNDVIVEFKEQSKSKRELILINSSRMKILQSDDFLRLKPGRRPQRVRVIPQMTNHYKRLEKKSKEHIRNGLLVSSCIGNRGLAVKVSENSMEEFVNSCRELDGYVIDNNKPISAPNTPKRGRIG